MNASHLPRAIACLAILAAALLAACGQPTATNVPSPSAVDAVATFPPGAEGAVLARARRLLDQTPALMPAYVGGAVACSSCHLAAGTRTTALPFLGIYAKFPQFNARAHRYITVQDRLAECFLYSMNGKVPAYQSAEMVALTTYIAWLSRGAVVGKGFPDVKMPMVSSTSPPDASNGKTLYAARCSMCHGVTGAGVAGAIPPVWGPKSFNTGAGMHREDMLASFVRANMPPGGTGALSEQEARDVAAYILRQPRPRFRTVPQIFEPEPATFF